MLYQVAELILLIGFLSFLLFSLHLVKLRWNKNLYVAFIVVLWFISYLFGHLGFLFTFEIPGIGKFITPFSTCIYTLIFIGILLVYVTEGASEARSLIYTFITAQVAVLLMQIFVYYFSSITITLQIPASVVASLFDPSYLRFAGSTISAVISLFFTIALYQFLINRLSFLPNFILLFISLAIGMAFDSMIFLLITRFDSFTERFFGYTALKVTMVFFLSIPFDFYLRYFLKHYKLDLKRGSLDILSKIDSQEEFLTLTGQGFFSIDSKMEIVRGYSKECDKIFNKENLGGLDIGRLLFENQLNRKDFYDSLRLYFSGKARADVVFELLPKQVTIQGKSIAMEYKAKGRFHIACIVADISKKQELEEKLKAEQEGQERLYKAISSRKYFSTFLDSAKRLFALLDTFSIAGNLGPIPAKNMKTVRLLLHDFKANLGFFGANDAAFAAHELEGILGSTKEYLKLPQFIKKVKMLESSFEKYLDFLKGKIDSSWFEELSSISIPVSRVVQIEKKIKDKYPQDSEIAQAVGLLRQVKAGDIFYYFPAMVQDLAERLEKRIFPVTIQGGDVLVPIDIFTSLANVFVHLVRNMVFHGIESPAERVAKGKPEVGRITIEVAEKSIGVNGKEHYTGILFSDDGRGIDLEKIKRVASQKGLLDGAKTSKKEILLTMFSPDVSTISEMDDTVAIAGRGVGLASVKEEVVRLQGRISVETEMNKGTVFSIYIPTE